MTGEGEHGKEMIEATGTEVTVVPNSSNDLLMALIQKDAPLEMMERFMDLRDREDVRIARKAGIEAMAAFKKDPPEILKTAHVEYVNNKQQTVQWDHAELGRICEAINAGLSKYDLFANWGLEQPDEKTVVVTCTVTHALGYEWKVTMKGPPDTSGGKDQLMAVTSTNTRLQRYTLLAVTGIAAKGMDAETVTDDMTGAALEFITAEQVGILSGLAGDAQLDDDDISRFLAVAEAEEVSTILQSKYIEAKNLLDRAVSAHKKREAK